MSSKMALKSYDSKRYSAGPWVPSIHPYIMDLGL